jgi:hypothetical protein
MWGLHSKVKPKDYLSRAASLYTKGRANSMMSISKWLFGLNRGAM